MQPNPQDYDFDLNEVMATVVGLKTSIAADALTAEALGTERLGSGVIIRGDGIILTIGYLITEAEGVWITLPGGKAVPGAVTGYDQETGFGLVQALVRDEFPAIQIGSAEATPVGSDVVIAGAGGLRNCTAAEIVAKQEFAGYWEYLLDEAIFTAPATDRWGGSPLIGPDGKLIGIGSLHIPGAVIGGRTEDLNMSVPIDILMPVMEDLLHLGRRSGPARPWLGLFSHQVGPRIVVSGLVPSGPAARAGLRRGDVILAVCGQTVVTVEQLFRRLWEEGPAGTVIPLAVNRDGAVLDFKIESADRRDFLKRPTMH